MERLTEREPYWLGEEFWTSAKEPDDEEIDKVYEKLKQYEDLEEQGLLLRIPCKLGDTVYCIMTGLSYKNPSIFKMKFGYELIKHFGKRVFLTKEEAEASLHIQGENTVNQDNNIKND